MATYEAAEHQAARVFRAPGRVNLVGEHTDYSGGFCMPAAIQFETRVAASRPDRPPTEAALGRVQGDGRGRSGCAPGAPQRTLEQLLPGRGVESARGGIRGARRGVDDHRRRAAGRWVELLGVARGGDRDGAAGACGEDDSGAAAGEICQRAENDFVGAPCGIMDQFISANGPREAR